MSSQFFLKKPEFTRSLRGYTVADVDNYFKIVNDRYSALSRENSSLKKKLSALTSELNTYTADEERKKRAGELASLEAEMIIERAHEKAADIIRKAEYKATAIEDAGKFNVRASYRIASEMRSAAVDFKDKLFKEYASQMEQIEELISLFDRSLEFEENSLSKESTFNTVNLPESDMQVLPSKPKSLQNVQTTQDGSISDNAGALQTPNDCIRLYNEGEREVQNERKISQIKTDVKAKEPHINSNVVQTVLPDNNITKKNDEDIKKTPAQIAEELDFYTTGDHYDGESFDPISISSKFQIRSIPYNISKKTNIADGGAEELDYTLSDIYKIKRKGDN